MASGTYPWSFFGYRHVRSVFLYVFKVRKVEHHYYLGNYLYLVARGLEV
jgi:hypothetical protein